MDEKIYATLTMTLEDVDIVLNALEEKSLHITNLRTELYNNVNTQVQQIKQSKEMLEEKGKNKQMENIKLQCKDCGKEFDFTAGEQRFYEEKGFAAPIRCKECRDIKKQKNIEKQGNNLDDMLKKFQENTIKL